MFNCNAYCNNFKGRDLTWYETTLTQLEADDLCVRLGENVRIMAVTIRNNNIVA